MNYKMQLKRYKENKTTLNKLVLSETCVGLDPSWENAQSSASFPITRGTVITVSCDPDYIHSGDTEITCDRREHFYFTTQPLCTLRRKKITLYPYGL